MIALVILGGCDGSNSALTLSGGQLTTPAAREEPGNPAPNPLAGLPGLPPDTEGNGLPALERQGQVLDHIVKTGSDTYQRAPATAVEQYKEIIYLEPGAETCWAIYDFAYLTDNELPALVVAGVKPPFPGHLWCAVSDFGSGSWFWQEVPILHEEARFGIPYDMQALSPQGRLFVLLFAAGESTVVRDVTLWFDVDAPEPRGLVATRDEFMDRINLQWDDPAELFAGLDYDGIQVLRFDAAAQDWIDVAEVAAGITTYSDIHEKVTNPLPYDTDLLYTIRTVVNGRAGPAAPAVIGRRRAADNFLTATDGTYPGYVYIRWDPVPDAEYYDLMYSLDGDDFSLLATIMGGASHSYLHEWNNPPQHVCAVNTAYFYRLQPSTELYAETLPTVTGSRKIVNPGLPSVSYGIYPDKIIVSWWDCNVPSVGYKIYRDVQDEEHVIATIRGSSGFEDYCGDDVQHAYWIRPYYQSESYDFSPPQNGITSGGLLQSYDIGVGAFDPFLSLAAIDGKPACIIESTGSHDFRLLYAGSQTVAPTSQGDWAVHELSAYPDGGILCYGRPILTDLDGKPAISYETYSADSQVYSLVFAAAASSTPQQDSDWTSYQLQTSEGGSSQLAFMHLNGMLSMVFCDSLIAANDRLRYARAVKPEPAEAGDWSIHTVIEETPQLHFGRPFAAGVVANRPAIMFANALEENARYLATAGSSMPTTSADWSLDAVPIGGPVYGGGLFGIDSAPVFAYYEAANRRVMYAEFSPADGDDPAGWRQSAIDQHVYYSINDVELAEYDGRPIVAYNDDAMHQVKIAVANVQHPSGSSDWTVRAVPHSAIDLDIEVIDDALVAVLGNYCVSMPLD